MLHYFIKDKNNSFAIGHSPMSNSVILEIKSKGVSSQLMLSQTETITLIKELSDNLSKSLYNSVGRVTV